MENFTTMDSTLLTKLLNKKGQFGSVRYARDVKQKKGSPVQNVKKEVLMSIRAGVEYDNLKVVKEKRDSGELPKENAGLPWGKWVAYPYLIEHKGEHYARFTPNGIPQVKYFIEGKEVSRDEALKFALASEISSGEKPDAITINLNNILELK